MQPDPFALPAFILAIVSLAVASIGAFTGIVALVWQMTTRRRGAHNVRVSVNSSLLTYSGGGVSDWLIGVSAANVGAAPVTVVGWGFALPNKRGAVRETRSISGSTPLPHRLEAGTSMDLFMDPERLHAVLAEQEPRVSGRDVRAFVALATGVNVHAKRRGVPL